MNRNHPTASTREPKSNGSDRVVRTLRVYESGRVAPVPGRPPNNWQQVIARAAAHALPADGPTPPTPYHPVPAKAKNPAKVAAGKARAAQAAARKAAEALAKTPPPPAPAPKKAPAKAASKPKAKPAAKAKPKAPAAKKTRGGARAGSGPKPANGDAMVVAAFRVTKPQKAKLAKLGAAWLRARIDAATIR